MGASQRRKGAAWERAVANALKVVYAKAKRGFVQSRDAREDCDVIGTPWWVECKKGKRVNVLAALRQSIKDSDGRPPLVVVGQDREVPFVAMTLEDFLKLAEFGVSPVVRHPKEET